MARENLGKTLELSCSCANEAGELWVSSDGVNQYRQCEAENNQGRLVQIDEGFSSSRDDFRHRIVEGERGLFFFFGGDGLSALRAS